MTNDEARKGAWRAEIDRRLEQGDGLEFSLAQFAASVAEPADDGALRAYLDELVVSATADVIPTWRCPVAQCRRVLVTSDVPLTICPYCHTDYQEEGLEVLVEQFYRLNGDLSRDIRWMIVVHGMNSRAKWQEEFSWQIANRLRYSAPVLIYKYGWATIDVLVTWLHRVQAKRLGERMRIAIGQAVESRRPARPDVIAHSFGTRLLSIILEDLDFDDLVFGRVIIAGSIVRPDFDWNRHVSNGRIEALLNHVGAKDKAVPAAQYAIPGTGPGGVVGYAAKSVINVRAADFGHSDFFEPGNLRALIGDGGLWHSFLTHPMARFRPDGSFVPGRAWKPASLLLRAPARALGYVAFSLASPISWLRRRLDP